MSDKDYKFWRYSKENLIVVNDPVIMPKQSLMDERPKDALLVEPLPPKDGYVVCVCDFNDKGRPTSTEYIVDNRGKLKFSKDNVFSTDEVREIGELESEFTLKEPPSQFSVWDESIDDWKENTAKKEHFWVQETLTKMDKQLELVLDGDDRATNTEAEIRAYRKALRDYTSYDQETDTYTIRGESRPEL